MALKGEIERYSGLFHLPLEEEQPSKLIGKLPTSACHLSVSCIPQGYSDTGKELQTSLLALASRRSVK